MVKKKKTLGFLCSSSERDSVTKFFLKLRLWGFRLCPTDVSTFNSCTVYTLPLVCYDRLKTTFVEVKQISPLCKPRMHITVSVSEL